MSLDDKRNEISDNDIPDLKSKYKEIVDLRKYNQEPKENDKWFWVTKEEIKSNKYDLSISKYKKITYTPVAYEKPEVLLSQIKELEKQILEGLNEIGKMI